MVAWLLFTEGRIALLHGATLLTPAQWHAHEMIFGYTFAVIAGFLLTAVGNWTGREAAQGLTTLIPCIPWLIARLIFLLSPDLLLYAAAADLLFSSTLLILISRPVILTKKWAHIGVVSKVVFLTAVNALFYLSALGHISLSTTTILTAGVYLVIALILTIGFRVLPAYTQIALNLSNAPTSDTRLSIATLGIFVLLFINKVSYNHSLFSSFTAFALFVVVTLRLFRSFHLGIFSRPLLWGLFSALFFIDIGFLIEATTPYYAPAPNLAIHAYTVGGVGLSTVAMMARVILGHTGRTVLAPPKALAIPLACVLVAALSRVGLPYCSPGIYLISIVLTQICWIVCFATFLFIFAKMLILPRPDGKLG